MLTRLPSERVVATKCGDISGAVAYLLNFINPLETRTFRPFKGYQIELQGRNDAGKFTNLSHGFILLNDGLNWILIDSYIGCREFTCRFVDVNTIQRIIERLEQSFDREIWLQLTGCPEQSASRLMVLIYEYDYDLTGMKERFHSLVKRAQHRLDQEEIGMSDEYLELLDPDLNDEAADRYLDSLTRL